MANRDFITHKYNYNPQKENVNTVAWQEHVLFDMEVMPYAKDYINLVISSSKTYYTTSGKTQYIVKNKNVVPREVTLDEARLVLLGGTFEKVGKQDEVVGGGSQKVGSDNKQ